MKTQASPSPGPKRASICHIHSPLHQIDKHLDAEVAAKGGKRGLSVASQNRASTRREEGRMPTHPVTSHQRRGEAAGDGGKLAILYNPWPCARAESGPLLSYAVQTKRVFGFRESR